MLFFPTNFLSGLAANDSPAFTDEYGQKASLQLSSLSCALITQNNPHRDPVSIAIFKALGKSKARQLLLMSVDIAIIAGLKSDILSTLSSWVTPTVQGKAIVSGPGENYVQSP